MFGGGGRPIHLRIGIMDFEPLQPGTGDKVRIAVIGTAETVEGFELLGRLPNRRRRSRWQADKPSLESLPIMLGRRHQPRLHPSASHQPPGAGGDRA